eukprot:s5644_g2.t1
MIDRCSDDKSANAAVGYAIGNKLFLSSMVGSIWLSWIMESFTSYSGRVEGALMQKATGAKLRSAAEESVLFALEPCLRDRAYEEECANNFVNDLIQGALAEDVNVATEDVTFYESDEDCLEDDVFSLADPSEDEDGVQTRRVLLDLANVLAKRVVQQGWGESEIAFAKIS